MYWRGQGEKDRGMEKKKQEKSRDKSCEGMKKKGGMMRERRKEEE